MANYLDSISMTICARYLEYIIAERHEEIPDFHDRLSVTYLDMTLAAKRKSDESELTFVEWGVFLTYFIRGKKRMLSEAFGFHRLGSILLC